MMNVEILTQKYQQLFNSLENDRKSVQKDDIAKILKDKQEVNDNLIDQNIIEDGKNVKYAKMDIMQKVYTGLNN